MEKFIVGTGKGNAINVGLPHSPNLCQIQTGVNGDHIDLQSPALAPMLFSSARKAEQYLAKNANPSETWLIAQAMPVGNAGVVYFDNLVEVQIPTPKVWREIRYHCQTNNNTAVVVLIHPWKGRWSHILCEDKNGLSPILASHLSVAEAKWLARRLVTMVNTRYKVAGSVVYLEKDDDEVQAARIAARNASA